MTFLKFFRYLPRSFFIITHALGVIFKSSLHTFAVKFFLGWQGTSVSWNLRIIHLNSSLAMFNVIIVQIYFDRTCFSHLFSSFQMGTITRLKHNNYVTNSHLRRISFILTKHNNWLKLDRESLKICILFISSKIFIF